MNARVQRESQQVQSLVSEDQHDPEVRGVIARPARGALATSKVQKPTADQVEAYRAGANDARAGLVGRHLEGVFYEGLAAIPEGGKAELEVSMKGSAKLHVSAKAKFAVERKGGAYLVTFQGTGGVGLGARVPGAEASISANLEGTVTYRFGSRKEAADALSALVQVAPEVGRVGGPLGLMAAGLARVVRDEDAVPRVVHAAEKLSSVQLAAKLVAEGKISSPLDQVKFELGADQTLTPLDCKLDLEKGELVVSQSVESGLKASASQALVPDKLKASTTLGEVRAKVILEERFPLPPDAIGKVLREGPGGLMEIASRGRMEAKIRLEGSVGGVEFKGERKGSPVELLKSLATGEGLLGGKDWSFQGFKVNAGLSASVDGGPVQFGLSARTKLPIIDQQGELVSLVGAAPARLEEVNAQERALLAAQALAR